MRHESFSTPGPVTLDIRIPAGDVEIETDNAGETAVELQARGRDPEQLEHDAEISMRPRGDGFEVRVEAGNGRGGLFRGRSGEYRVRIAAPHGATVRAQLASADISGRGSYAALDIKVGYPERWRDYAGVLIARDDLVGNLLRAARAEHAREVARLGRPVDRGEWAITPQIGNASSQSGLRFEIRPRRTSSDPLSMIRPSSPQAGFPMAIRA